MKLEAIMIGRCLKFLSFPVFLGLGLGFSNVSAQVLPITQTQLGLNDQFQTLGTSLLNQLPIENGDAPIIQRSTLKTAIAPDRKFFSASAVVQPIQSLGACSNQARRRLRLLAFGVNPQGSETGCFSSVVASTEGATNHQLWQGNQISLNGRSFSAAWTQWRDGNEVRTGVSDTTAMQLLGLELLNTANPSIQPVRWFSPLLSAPFLLPTKFNRPNRYLDMTELAQQAGLTLQVSGETLILSSPPTRIENIYAVPQLENLGRGDRFVVSLNRPTFWQVSQVKNEAVITIEGLPTPEVLARFSPLTPVVAPEATLDENLIPTLPTPTLSPLTVEAKGNQTQLRLSIPQGLGLRISTLPNPNRLVIDLRPDAMIEQDIIWQPGIRWRQQFVMLDQGNQRDVFPVKWLEVNPKTPGVSIKPILSNSEQATGTAPLMNTAKWWQASAAINGGFFNRNNQLPLGAIRRNGRWISGPILDRAAIAWDDAGNVNIGRLSLSKILTTEAGVTLPISFLNSGYVKAGASLYTPDWGPTYTPLIDDEIVVVVEGDRITQHLPGGIAGESAFPIPQNGYLLTLRATSGTAKDLPVGTKVKLDLATSPQVFNDYPYILGAGPLLVQNKQIVLNGQAEQFSEAFNRQAASRSAIGITEKGTLIIAAVHNRTGGGGPTLLELAQLMQRLGAVDVLNLDGGSSTGLYLGGQLLDRSPVTAARVHNGLGIFLK
ncbi:MAG: phosphodiester glycosidase family protein [Cyanobacteriota bacterium]